MPVVWHDRTRKEQRRCRATGAVGSTGKRLVIVLAGSPLLFTSSREGAFSEIAAKGYSRKPTRLRVVDKTLFRKLEGSPNFEGVTLYARVLPLKIDTQVLVEPLVGRLEELL